MQVLNKTLAQRALAVVGALGLMLAVSAPAQAQVRTVHTYHYKHVKHGNHHHGYHHGRHHHRYHR